VEERNQICNAIFFSASHTTYAHHVHLHTASNQARVPIHSQCNAPRKSNCSPAPKPSVAEPSGLLPPSPSPSFLSDVIPVPAILVKLLAEAASASCDINGLFRLSQDGRSPDWEMEFLTCIGRSKIVYASVPLRRKFWRIDI